MENENTAKGLIGSAAKMVWEKYLWPELKQIPMGFANMFKMGPGIINRSGRIDFTYFLIVIGLTAFGLITHYSASYENKSQLIFALAGIVMMLAIAHLKTDAYKEFSAFFLFICVILLFIVLTRGEYNGTRRRLVFFQPSEVAKVAFIMYLAYLLDKYKKTRTKTSQFAVFFSFTLCFVALLLLESHLSGAILFFCIGYSMMWYAGLSKKGFIIITAMIVAGVLLIVWQPRILDLIPGFKDYQISRIEIWKKILGNRELTLIERRDAARQSLQSLYGIGSGGIFGVGFGNSGQKVSNLAEKANDFIFAVLAEEGGFIASIFMLILFGALTVRGFKIALNSKTYFGSLLALGVSTQMALQVLINVGVATSLLPNTGISLPFFSGGGTSLIFSLASMGLVLGVSKESNNTKTEVKKNAEG